MPKDTGHYFLDDEAQKKVAKARALDEALLGRHYNKEKTDESHTRIFGDGKKKLICAECKKEIPRAIITIEDNKTVTRCYKCNDKVKR